MKTLFLSIMVFALVGISSKVLLEEKKATLVDFSTVTYYLNENKKLDSAYTIENREKKVWLRGSYKESERTGNWYCFNSDGKVFLRYNYNLNKLLFLDTNAMKNVDVNILDDNKDIQDKASIPLPICSMDQYVSLFGSQIGNILSKDNSIVTADVPIEVVANLDRKGRVDYHLAYLVGNLTINTPLKLQETKFDVLWLASTYEGKIIPSEFRVKTIFKRGAASNMRFKWNY